MGRIGLSHELRQTMGQHLLLLPRMLQSIEVLALSGAELEAWLRRAAEENEALALGEPRAPLRSRPERIRASDDHAEMLANHPDRARAGQGALEQQLGLLEASPEELAWVRFLLQCLDERGYLAADDETLLRLGREHGLEAGEDLLARAIALLKTLDPRGVGARSAVEALLLQVDPDDPDHPLLRALLGGFLEELARNKLPAVARAMGLELSEIQRLLARLRRLELRPAEGLFESGVPPVRPDVVVVPSEGGFEVRVEASTLPAARIDPSVQRLARDAAQPAGIRSYLRGRIDRARWLIEALEQRADTLARVAGKVFERQRAFLESGPGHLVPLRMKEIAQELGLHVSTISRAVAGKHADTPWGIRPLRWFFQAPSPVEPVSGAEAARADAPGAARDDVRELVRALFAAEDPRAPLSDDEAVARLRERGIQLARRTVAKYRSELGIQSSYRRRAYD